LNVERDQSRHPLFQTMFILQKPHRMNELAEFVLGEAGAVIDFAGLPMESMKLEQKAAQFDLTLTMVEAGEALSASWEYNSDLFDASTIERMAKHFELLLSALVSNPKQKVAEAPFLTEAERYTLEHVWNNTAIDCDCEATIHGLFEAQAVRTPDKTAVVFEDQSLTFRELNRRANQLARRLQAHGVGPDTPVGICMERSLEMMVGLLAILKAGGAYVPLDPTYPAERLNYMLEDSNAKVLLTKQRLLNILPKTQAHTIAVDAEWDAIQTEADSNLSVAVTPSNLAYMIYTSGSTGKPKGVMIEHRNAVNFFHGMDQRIGTGEEDSILAVTSICFDISVLELFWTLTRGTKVVLLSEQEASGGLIQDVKKQGNGMKFSLFYFASSEGEDPDDKYRLLIEGAKFADRNGFTAVWTPERHFHEFGGLYPNPAVISSALAMVTERVELRSGSVVLPLHNPIRIAEEWSVVDNLSKGRVSLSFAPGWQPNDFVLAPDNYQDRHRLMFEGIETVQKLWAGEAVPFRSGAGNVVPVKILPRPVQKTLPIWITSAGNKEMFIQAGKMGADILTHLLGQSIEDVAEKIALYRQARQEAGFDPEAGRVALMLHTFVGTDMEEVREKVREPFKAYLRTSLGLIENLVKSLDLDVDLEDENDLNDIIDFAFHRYVETSSFIGTPESLYELSSELKKIGVDEIACLIDFGVPADDVLESLTHLNTVREMCRIKDADEAKGDFSLAAQAALHKATLMQCTPSLMRLLCADASAMEALLPLQKLLLGGEALPPALAGQLMEALPNTRLFNMYGPTEATVWATTHEVTADDAAKSSVTIGRPFANVTVYIAGKALEPNPIGVPGELLIGGKGIARGYLGRPELTAEKFVADPFSDEPGARLYRTGDLARFLPDGSIEFLGRIDHQVKVRGFRIELGEIEALLSKHPDIGQAVVIVREDVPGDKRIVAYLTAKEGTAPTQDELREYVRSELPDYMVPSAYMLLSEFPLTLNGKIDYKALPAPVQNEQQAAYVAPRTELEARVAELWSQVLGYEPVGVHDHFFDRGGHSLLATQLVARIRQLFGVDIPLRNLFDVPTVAGLARQIEALQVEQADAGKLNQLLRHLENLSDEELENLSDEELEALMMLEE
jgi:natural product biosynthesis luciferase-like monooxygenase protein